MVNQLTARDYIYEHGTLWERALYSWLFEGGSLERLHACWRLYKNEDGGFGHRLEHDVSYPGSHPLALEFLLSTIRFFEVPVGNLLEGTATWMESIQKPDGSLHNPLELLSYPHAPWWQGGGQTEPDSLVANLQALGHATPSLLEKTRAWVLEHRTVDAIRQNEWLFMAYHAYDYFWGVDQGEAFAEHRQATVENINALAEKAPDTQASALFKMVTTPELAIVHDVSPRLIERLLDVLERGQQPEGHWLDEHHLPQWYCYQTITVLMILRRFNRITS